MTDKPPIVAFLMKQEFYDPYVSLHRDSNSGGVVYPLIRLTDHEAAIASTEPTGSYQRGYDDGRNLGTRHRAADIQQLEAARTADKARIAELEAALTLASNRLDRLWLDARTPRDQQNIGDWADEARAALAQQGKEGE